MYSQPCSLSLRSLSLRYRCLLRACARRSSLQNGRRIHAFLITSGIANCPTSFLRNALLHLYSACDQLRDASKVFDDIPFAYKDTVDWTTLMGCFARRGMLEETLKLFIGMRREGLVVDDLAMVTVFNLCARLGDVEVGLQGHGCMIRIGLGLSVKVCNSVMDMYVKCLLFEEAKRLFEEMEERSVVSWTVMLDCVAKFEGVRSGKEVFDKMQEKNEVAWTIMISRCLEDGFTKEGFSLLYEMIFSYQLVLNYVALCSILSACSQSGDVIMGKWVHAYALKAMGKDMEIIVSTSLVDMYAKCGKIDSAVLVFNNMSRRNVVTWNAMLSGLAMHGRGKAVVEIFPKMVEEAIPDEVTFTSLLSACSHSGLVDQGRHYFHKIETVYGLTPTLEHYACMVDILGRAGRLEEAEVFIKTMPMPPNEIVLGSLLGSCNIHGKLKLGEHILQELVQMYPNNVEYHVLLSNMYVVAGKGEAGEIFRSILRRKGIRKVPGMSYIRVYGQVHRFTSGDKSHLRTHEIYLKLNEMICKLKSAGYVPNTTYQVFSSSDGGENEDAMEEKEQALFSHSEKLAVCFGLISTRAGAPLSIFKNLRTCQDCHSALKIVSNLYEREIVVRDRNRFHCFRREKEVQLQWWNTELGERWVLFPHLLSGPFSSNLVCQAIKMLFANDLRMRMTRKIGLIGRVSYHVQLQNFGDTARNMKRTPTRTNKQQRQLPKRKCSIWKPTHYCPQIKVLHSPFILAENMKKNNLVLQMKLLSQQKGKFLLSKHRQRVRYRKVRVLLYKTRETDGRRRRKAFSGTKNTMPYYSVTEEDVHEFDEYDPTPYGGGYDIYLTYGRSLAPSEEICYPNSSPDSEEIDYERPQFSSDAEPCAYADDALNTEYSSYARPKPRPGPAYGFTPGGAEGEGGYGGGSYVNPPPAYGFQPGHGGPEVPGSENESGYGRKQDYEQRPPESGYESGYRRRPDAEIPEPEYGSGYGRRPDPDSYGSEYGSGGGRMPQSDDSYGRRTDPDYYGSEYGSGRGRMPQSDDSYGSGHGRPTEYEDSNRRPGYEAPEPNYGSEYGRKPRYGEEEGCDSGYGRRPEYEKPSYEDEPPRRPSYERPSYGGSEEAEYEKPRYERREDEDEDRPKYGYGEEDYGRKKYGDNSDDEDEEKKHRHHKHHPRRNYDDE